MNKISILTMSIAVALTGCGSDDSSKPIEPTTFTLTAIDGYLQNAKVGVMTGQDCDTSQFNKTTDGNGQVELDTKYQNMALCIRATQGITIDSTRGIVHKSFELTAPEGTTVVNPMNNIVANLMQADTTLTEADAKQQVINALVASNPDLELDTELVFGDYHHSSVAGSTQAQALNLVGEILVDHNDNALDMQVKLVEKVAEEAIKAINNNNGKLPASFTPVIEIPEQGEIIVTPNHRPVVVSPLKAINIEFGKMVELNIVEHFNDQDGDRLTYSLSSLSETSNGLSIDSTSGVISGTPQLAGEYHYQIFATDEHGARSYPLDLMLKVEVENTAPVINPEVEADIQKELNALSLTEGEEITHTIDVSNLFTDSDGDALNYTAKSSLDNSSFSTLVTDAVVSFEGNIPHAANAGDETLTVTVSDNINPAVEVAFTLPKIDETVVTPPPVPELGFTLEHFNNENWKMGSFADRDGEIGHASLTRNGDELSFCWGSNDDATQSYKTNISKVGLNQLFSSLEKLDELADYVESGAGDCWPIELRDGKLYSTEGEDELEYEMLYQNADTANGYQIILKIDGDELFWLDSTDTTFANTMDASKKVSADKTEYDMTVEAEGDVEPELYYSAGEYKYNSSTAYEYSSILPEGFYTPGTWEIYQDNDGNDIVKVIEAEEDQKTRLRYVQRDFGEFYIAVKWTKDGIYQTAPEYGLFSSDKQAMLDVLENNLPIISD